MLEKLYDTYEFAIVDHEDKNMQTSSMDVLTLEDESKNKLTFHKQKLTEEEIRLLRSLYTVVYEGETKEQSPVLSFWYNLLLKNKTNENSDYKFANDRKQNFRFIHFLLKDTPSETESFQVALESLFPETETIIWRSGQAGVLIQRVDENDDEPHDHVQQYVDTLVSDFFIQLWLYIGSPFTGVEHAYDRYQFENTGFYYARKQTPRKSVFIEQEIILQWLLSQLDETTKQKFIDKLHPVGNDYNLLQTVKTFLDCNMNISSAAKSLYMHRNSLQYRIDKFIERTNIDIKKFHNAAAVYVIMMLLHDHSNSF
ncbi:PucR family transcriptional regulator [Texcoconibacillus texcoconensis]|uniref:DNA-binding PucR family transcriptional regulator n=1 Tax=Texcoconibacillus texcoconensis TaxID=1095777 RepID=A0A840QPL1_9BACI|nr:helix-turn-helix domain-containing protein [Texcoconibacillus texcoconensis]MBB5173263.1 DNA-binding PucR family transcriptional regulator [Texcoconibacillus texcoconensis]